MISPLGLGVIDHLKSRGEPTERKRRQSGQKGRKQCLCVCAAWCVVCEGVWGVGCGGVWVVYSGRKSK